MTDILAPYRDGTISNETDPDLVSTITGIPIAMFGGPSVTFIYEPGDIAFPKAWTDAVEARWRKMKVRRARRARINRRGWA